MNALGLAFPLGLNYALPWKSFDEQAVEFARVLDPLLHERATANLDFTRVRIHYTK